MTQIWLGNGNRSFILLKSGEAEASTASLQLPLGLVYGNFEEFNFELLHSIRKWPMAVIFQPPRSLFWRELILANLDKIRKFAKISSRQN